MVIADYEKEKIAFVVSRYGKDINGGAELHCKMLAERLSEYYDVEILTTCIKNYVTGEHGYTPGRETVDGIDVIRFETAPEDTVPEKKWRAKVRAVRRIRRFLYKAGWLEAVAGRYPVWKWKMEEDVNAFRSSKFYSPDMIEYISAHKSEYKAIFAMTAIYAPFYFTASVAGEKMIGVPTLHPERASFRPALTSCFTQTRYLAYNTEAEQKLAEDIFGRQNIRGGIVSTGIEDIEADDWESVRMKYGLPDKYIVFVGRIEKGKAGKLVNHYIRYCKTHPDAMKLVMVGGIVKELKKHRNIIYTGFVSDREKRSIMMNAALLVNPSKYESLSLVVLEALRDNVPVLVNGKNEVLKGHCTKSGGAVKYFTSYKSFRRNLELISTDENERKRMIGDGRKYFDENYRWEIIVPRLLNVINEVSGK